PLLRAPAWARLDAMPGPALDALVHPLARELHDELALRHHGEELPAGLQALRAHHARPLEGGVLRQQPLRNLVEERLRRHISPLSHGSAPGSSPREATTSRSR